MFVIYISTTSGSIQIIGPYETFNEAKDVLLADGWKWLGEWDDMFEKMQLGHVGYDRSAEAWIFDLIKPAKWEDLRPNRAEALRRREAEKMRSSHPQAFPDMKVSVDFPTMDP